MSDFDFDEIDKAVADALTPDQPDETPRSFDGAEQKPEVAKVEPAPAEEEQLEAPAEKPKPAPAARRSSGRFMDVVHPSSDMRTQSSAVKSSFTPPKQTTKEITSSEPVDAGDDTKSSDTDTPLESPFLPHAKVEKRPLGAFSESSPDDTQTAADEEEIPAFKSLLEDELLLEAPDEARLEAHIMPDPIDFAAHANALPSESEDTGALQAVEEEEALVPHEDESIEPAQSEQASEPGEVEVVEVPVEAEPVKLSEDEPVGPASISQQYTEQPSSAPESGAIYDTENYHQPLTPAPKKRSGAWTFVWILLLVILGAGAGVAFYLFVLPMF